MLVRRARGLGAARIDDHDPAAAGADRPEPRRACRRRHDAAVGHERVGADAEEEIGSIQIRHRHQQAVAEHTGARPPCAAAGRRSWPSTGSSSRGFAAGAGRTSSGRDCEPSDCPDTRRRRRGRATSGSARAPGRHGRRLRPTTFRRHSPPLRIMGGAADPDRRAGRQRGGLGTDVSPAEGVVRVTPDRRSPSFRRLRSRCRRPPRKACTSKSESRACGYGFPRPGVVNSALNSSRNVACD